ncbi:hypothetical protein FB565_005799 [Actinoplanes lutulentus]|nr:hypothetical protein [Actinoplanes lutulentus]MBB2946041.1 hypothetical protein [Actinoplanes lutulentus]
MRLPDQPTDRVDPGKWPLIRVLAGGSGPTDHAADRARLSQVF